MELLLGELKDQSSQLQDLVDFAFLLILLPLCFLHCNYKSFHTISTKPPNSQVIFCLLRILYNDLRVGVNPVG